VQRVPAESRPHSQSEFLGTGTGYFSRVSQWIRESF
jgi:hypothetical protein